MLVVISNPVKLDGEVAVINRLLSKGLPVFHLRKPEYSSKQLSVLLRRIDERFHHRIALHQHYKLAGFYGLKRLHFNEKARKEVSPGHFKNLCNNGFILSTSTHSTEEFEQLEPVFAYAFLGPVFNSISKNAYAGKQIVAAKNGHIKCLAIGGIEKNTVKTVSSLGYDGAAVLGAIWQSNDPVNTYQSIHELCSTAAPSY